MSVPHQYDAVLHGQLVTITVLPPGIAIGANPYYRPNVKCSTYQYGGEKPKRKRRRRKKSNFVPRERIHPAIQEVQ